ncbi:sugar porter family MFS transporter [Subsaximicrobium wynnwilliamsii]|uniref:Sugar porter family MFS transporter n=1 Tax=Subsaximicrobium wynnwilliamsii TaxID=291179 RepID=A0A5C6ZCE1_9FLAO|nr:sugar porter family MFS transporter [Subsaximicrobium wynnwilliamsii]TXD81972.1 sugar porter family MFS transporter [Subsaximicrobium wynnwilliamsii]TXD87670.1 sugar porter family MFS transporter [Subsaximicrobium wynnwilliamsii]TXE01416.1 sugar porter family MFS transporter [Subsaximicrobium wynnwilliamsii]
MNKRTFLLLITSVSALGGLLFGYDTGVINGAQFYLSKYFELDAAMKGWVVSSALVGCFVGAIVAGPLSIKIGRKYSLILSAILFSISAWGSGLPSMLPESVDLLVMFRIIGGLGIGIASMNAPMYIAEIAPPRKRGNLVSYYQLAIVVGFFIVFLATYTIGSNLTEEQNLAIGWRRMFWSELIPAGLFLILLFFVPQSPRWLAMKGKKKESLRILTKILGAEEAQRESVEIEKSLQKKNTGVKINYFSKGILTIIVIGTTLSVLQQFTGINAVLYYGADIFEQSLGFGKEDVLLQQILLAFVNLIFTFIAMATVDRIGRKPLIYIGSAGMLLGFLILGVTIQQQSLGILSLIGVLLFVASFAMSMGPVVWVLLSEMFPNNIRSVAMSVAVAAQWAANFVVSQSFPIVTESEVNNNAFWNGSLPYFIFIGFIIFIVVFTYKFIPETKGRSLEELEDIWDVK